ncbi:MAG TPA: hypothetical protein VND22_08450, partial [Actinomycetota bacterium]|nr:hypothetical protein [Actinomycetota bacterium]
YFGEAVHEAARVMGAGHGGQTLISSTTKDLLAGPLPEGTSVLDLGEHRLKDLRAPRRIFQVTDSTLQSEFPKLHTLESARHNLPVQRTSFIERESEIKKVVSLIEENSLVTITGPGGVGKTRLALQAGAEVIDRFSNGVWLAELGPVGDPGAVPDAVLTALDLRQGGLGPAPSGEPLEILTEELRARELLLILDNCEHVVDSAADLVDAVLGACPGVKIVTTSRDLLGVDGEATWRVPKLTLPGSQDDLPLELLAESEAVRLFVDRASKVVPDFQLTPKNAQAVAAICRRLDGVPHAIELAAAKVRHLSPEKISEGLGDVFRTLSGSARRSVARQQTLEATIAWSYNLLSDDERAVFRRLSVFVGGFTLEAAETVCSVEMNASDVRNLVFGLVDRSLLERETAVERFRLLETVRQYARERLRDEGEVEAARDRHTDWVLELFETSFPHAWGPGEFEVIEKLHPEFDNLVAALEWSEEKPDWDKVWRLYAPSAGHLILEGQHSLAMSWGQKCAAADASSGDLRLKARALSWAAMVFATSNNEADAIPIAEEAISIFRGLDDKPPEADLALALTLKALCLAFTGGGESEVTAVFDEAEEMTGVSDDFQIGWTKSYRGWSSYILAGDAERAREFLREGLDRFEKLGSEILAASGHFWIALMSLHVRDLATAIPHYEEALPVFRRLSSGVWAQWIMDHLGSAYLMLGDLTNARKWVEEGIEWSLEHGLARPGTNYPSLLWSLGDINLAEGSIDKAEALLTEARDLVEAQINEQQDGPTRPGNLLNYSLALVTVGEARGDHAAAASAYLDLLKRSLTTESYLTNSGAMWHPPLSGALGGLARCLPEVPAVRAKLMGAAEARLKSEGRTLAPWGAERNAALLRELEEQLGSSELERLKAEGAQLSDEELLPLAEEMAG